MRRLLAVVLACIAGGVVWYLFSHSGDAPVVPPQAAETIAAETNLPVNTPAPKAVPAEEQVSKSPNAVEIPPPQESATNKPVPLLLQTPIGTGASTVSGSIVLENMRTCFRNYGSRFGGNPVGTNVEITRALNGENPQSVKFIQPELGLRINDKGELIDPWGTPFFFHQLSASQMEIRSAGPDKEMWTADDLVTK